MTHATCVGIRSGSTPGTGTRSKLTRPGYWSRVFDIARWRARWPWLDAILCVTDRFGALRGGPLSSSIALAAFVHLFPLLLVIIDVLCFVSSGASDFACTTLPALGLQCPTPPPGTAPPGSRAGPRRHA